MDSDLQNRDDWEQEVQLVNILVLCLVQLDQLQFRALLFQDRYLKYFCEHVLRGQLNIVWWNLAVLEAQVDRLPLAFAYEFDRVEVVVFLETCLQNIHIGVLQLEQLRVVQLLLQ